MRVKWTRYLLLTIILSGILIMPVFRNIVSVYKIDANFNVNGTGQDPVNSPLASNNIALGQDALNNLEEPAGPGNSPSQNFAAMWDAMGLVSGDATNNIVIGVAAFKNANDGNNNIIFGPGAAGDLDDGNDNFVAGNGALPNGDGTTSRVIAIGATTFGAAAYDGNDNIGIGDGAGSGLELGNSGIYIGDGAGDASAGFTNGDNVLFIGKGASADKDVDNSSAIGPGAIATKSNQIMMGTATEVITLPGKIEVSEAANKSMGLATLVGGTVVVANTAITANSRLFLSSATAGGTQGNLSYVLNAGVGFTINSDNVLDTSTVAFLIAEPE